MYLWPGANLRLRSTILRQLTPGSRVASHEFGMGDWKPHRVERMIDSDAVPRPLHRLVFPGRRGLPRAARNDLSRG